MKVDTIRDDVHCECSFCHDVYTVEPDAFGDGCMTYYVPILAEQQEAGRDE